MLIMNSTGTSYGLALASGINAYLPLLSFAIAVRYFHWFTINQNFAFITQDGFIITLTVLAILDIIADKIPVVDSIWDGIHTIVRPIAGAIVVGASSSSVASPELPVELILGGVLSGMSHITKAITRLTASVSSFGCLNTGISIVEDVVVLAIILLAIFAPILMLAFSITFIILFIVFAPLLFSALRYRLRITFSILSWFVHSYFWREVGSGSSDFLLDLSDNDRAYLHQLLSGNVTLLGGVHLLWLRRLDGRGLWGGRRVALPTWFVVTDNAIILLPTSRPRLTQVVPFSQVQALVLDQGVLMGSLRLLTQQSQAYSFTILRDSLGKTVDLVEMLHIRHRLPSSATTHSGTAGLRSTGPQRI